MKKNLEEKEIEEIIDRDYSYKTDWEKTFIKKSLGRYGTEYTYHNVKGVKSPDEPKYYKRVIVTCKIHGDFEIDPIYFTGNKFCKGCPLCHPGKITKKTKEKFMEQVHFMFPHYSEIPGKTNYVNNNEHVWLHCDIHNVDFKIKPGNLFQGKTGCKECYTSKKLESKRKILESEFKNFLENLYPGVIDFSEYCYKNAKTDIILKNKLTGENIINTPEHLKTMLRSGKSIFRQDRLIEYHYKLLKLYYFGDENLFDTIKKNYPDKTELDWIFIYKSIQVWGKDCFDYSKITYINESIEIELRCLIHNEWFKQTPNNHLDHQKKCKYCTGSKGEILIKTWLTNNNLNYKYRVLIDNPSLEGRNPGSKVEIDFILEFENKTIWIEFNGEQHYKFQSHFHDQEEYKKQIKRDENVKNYCKINNICLIEIPWNYERYCDLDNILQKTIFENMDISELIQIPKIEKP